MINHETARSSHAPSPTLPLTQGCHFTKACHVVWSDCATAKVRPSVPETRESLLWLGTLLPALSRVLARQLLHSFLVLDLSKHTCTQVTLLPIHRSCCHPHPLPAGDSLQRPGCPLHRKPRLPGRKLKTTIGGEDVASSLEKNWPFIWV